MSRSKGVIFNPVILLCWVQDGYCLIWFYLHIGGYYDTLLELDVFSVMMVDMKRAGL